MSEIARVLVVDDDESVLRSLQILLEDSGYSVQLARDGRKAIELLPDGFDLVLADLKMPGLNGISLLREIKQVSPDTGVVIITGHASLDTAIEAVREGASDYLLKMASSPVILVALERALEKQQLTLQLRRRNQALATLHAVAAAVGETFELPDLLDRALEATVETLGVLWGAVWIYSKESDTLDLVACRDCPEALEQACAVLATDAGVQGQAFGSRELAVVEDAGNDRDAALVPAGGGATVSAPLVAKGEVLGVMSLGVPASFALDREHLDLLRGVANHIAVGIENAQLYGQVVDQARELEHANADLTATRDALVSKERLAAIGQIVLTVGHEIRNPLTAIWGRANWLLESFEGLPDEIRADLRVIQDMCRRINQVVKRLQETRDRTVARLGETKMIDIGPPAEGQ